MATRPSLHDDGRTVTLDLHGATVDQAIGMIRRIAATSAARGRSKLRVVHGSSTSDAAARNRTIRHALHDLLDAGDLDSWVADDLRGDDATTLGLRFTGAADGRRLGQSDLRT